MGSNYEAILETWRRRFLEMDCGALAERFHLRMDSEWLYVTYFSREYGISRADGVVRRMDRPEEPVGFNVAIGFYNMFHYAVPHPMPSGRMVPFREVRRVYPFEKAFVRQTLQPFADRMAGRVEPLRRAFAALKAKPLAQGDVGGVLEIYPGLCMSVAFWDADDEFPAQANVLFDYNITDYMHEENVVMVASDALDFLEEEAADAGARRPENFRDALLKKTIDNIALP